MTPRVTAVVLSWNGTEETLGCLRSLAAATYPALSVVVVDNGSTDDVAAAVAGASPDVRVIRLDENRGFSGGVNAGLEAALASGADHAIRRALERARANGSPRPRETRAPAERR